MKLDKNVISLFQYTSLYFTNKYNIFAFLM